MVIAFERLVDEIELQVFQRLNTEVALRDSRNHTIRALRYLTFDRRTFVVMPR